MQKFNKKRTYLVIGIVGLLIVGGTAYLALKNHYENSTTSPANADGLTKREIMECVPRGHDNYRINEALVVDPGNADTIYAGVEYKGVYKTTDGGATWNKSDKGIRGYAKEQNENEKCVQEMGMALINPHDANHLLISRVESPGNETTRFTENAGLWESKDAGASWHQLIKPGMNFSGSHAIAFDPNDSKTIYYGVNNGHPSYKEGGNYASEEYFNKVGILYRSVDSGASWQELPTGLDKGFRATGVALDSKKPQQIWMMTFTQDQAANGLSGEDVQKGPMKSTDGGATWVSYSQKLPVGSRTVASGVVNPSDSDNVIINTQATGDPQHSFVTTDGGETWKPIQQTLYLAHYDTNDDAGNRVLAYDAFGEGGGGIYESRDKGVHWTKLSPLPSGVDNSDNFGVRIEDIKFSKAAKGTIFLAGSNANIWRSTDDGKTWSSIMTIDKIGGPNKNKEGNLKSREQDPSRAE